MELDQPLPSRALFLRERAERERAQGVTWSTEFPENIRHRLRDALQASFSGGMTVEGALTFHIIRILESHSQLNIMVMNMDSLFSFARKSDEAVDTLDAVALALTELATALNGKRVHQGIDKVYDYRPEAFLDAANDVLLDGRIAFTFIDGRLRERGAEPLHVDVIEPVEAALTSDSRFAKAEAAYQDAVTSMATGHYGASITSAGSALQQTLVGLGAKGGNLTALFADARNHGLLMGHDEKLILAFKSIGSWITADRSNRGTAHDAAVADRDDAELAIHIIASLIIRLVKLAPVETVEQL